MQLSTIPLKFKYEPLRNMLIQKHTKPMDEQKDLLSNTFEAWKGNVEQVDDVGIIGVKV